MGDLYIGSYYYALDHVFYKANYKNAYFHHDKPNKLVYEDPDFI